MASAAAGADDSIIACLLRGGGRPASRLHLRVRALFDPLSPERRLCWTHWPVSPSGAHEWPSK
eukprot:7833415-Pyramimonas_sp.AAC.1